jgi:hypothetical protein
MPAAFRLLQRDNRRTEKQRACGAGMFRCVARAPPPAPRIFKNLNPVGRYIKATAVCAAASEVGPREPEPRRAQEHTKHARLSFVVRHACPPPLEKQQQHVWLLALPAPSRPMGCRFCSTRSAHLDCAARGGLWKSGRPWALGRACCFVSSRGYEPYLLGSSSPSRPHALDSGHLQQTGESVGRRARGSLGAKDGCLSPRALTSLVAFYAPGPFNDKRQAGSVRAQRKTQRKTPRLLPFQAAVHKNSVAVLLRAVLWQPAASRQKAAAATACWRVQTRETPTTVCIYAQQGCNNDDGLARAPCVARCHAVAVVHAANAHGLACCCQFFSQGGGSPGTAEAARPPAGARHCDPTIWPLMACGGAGEGQQKKGQRGSKTVGARRSERIAFGDAKRSRRRFRAPKAFHVCAQNHAAEALGVVTHAFDRLACRER